MVSVRSFCPRAVADRSPWRVPSRGELCEKSEISSSFLIVIPIALAHYDLDASVLSLNDLYKGIQNDVETYYFLWVAVRKVLAEAPNVMLDLFKVPVGKRKLIGTHDILKKVQWRSCPRRSEDPISQRASRGCPRAIRESSRSRLLFECGYVGN